MISSGGRYLNVDVHGDAAIAFVRGLSGRLHSNLLRTVTELSIRLQALVKEKLSGPVLHVRTGTLRRSVNRVVIDEQARILAQVGTNLVYAAVHEFGFDGPVNVRAHVRRTYSEGGSVRQTALRSGQATSGEANVRAHVRNMHVPERSYLRSSLRDMASEIRNELRESAREAMHR